MAEAEKTGSVDAKAVVQAVVTEAMIVVGTMKDKGAKRFGRALGASGLMVFLAYAGLYMPPQQKSARLQSEIDKAKMMSEKGAQYKDLRDQLNAAYSGLPSLTERDQWLSNSVRDSLTGMETEDFKPVNESEANGLIFQLSAVTLKIHFAQLYDWILRIENAKPMMHLQTVDIEKEKEQIGLNTVHCSVSTVIPKTRFH